MFLAHLPAGFLLTDSLCQRTRLRHWPQQRALLLAGLLGSVFPDSDILWAHWVDQNRFYHHLYWVHWPLFWLALMAGGAALAGWLRSRFIVALVLLFGLNALLHIGLDAINREVWWGMPFVKHPVKLIDVPMTHQQRLLDYVYHWTFALEVLLCAWALRRIGQRPFKSPLVSGDS